LYQRALHNTKAGSVEFTRAARTKDPDSEKRSGGDADGGGAESSAVVSLASSTRRRRRRSTCRFLLFRDSY